MQLWRCCSAVGSMRAEAVLSPTVAAEQQQLKQVRPVERRMCVEKAQQRWRLEEARRQRPLAHRSHFAARPRWRCVGARAA